MREGGAGPAAVHRAVQGRARGRSHNLLVLVPPLEELSQGHQERLILQSIVQNILDTVDQGLLLIPAVAVGLLAVEQDRAFKTLVGNLFGAASERLASRGKFE